ncbi:MAG TPA: hypothetical protein VKU02_13385 [Gemmataceae bacterium]|nr:hypothetical protein [Gemmataceae bacterium]
MMIRRSGTTLIEVLVAIFVAALGLLGLLALFPLGAVSMAQAIKDSRCAQAAANAFALAETLNVRNDPQVIGNPDLFVDQGIVGIANGRPTPVLADPNGPSYPVFVDPAGWFLGSRGGALPAVGLPQAKALPRTFTSFANNAASAVRWFTLLDDLDLPKELPVFGESVVRREGRYSWVYLLRRPRSSNRSIVDLTVVVYSGRPNIFGQGETAYTPVVFDPTNPVVRVPWGPGQEKPAVRVGSWILDATKVRTVGTTFLPDPHGYFYRVVNVTEGNGYVDLELETKPKLGTTEGVLIVLDGVAEVFEKGPGWRP